MANKNATNEATKFRDFNIQLSNGANLSGIVYIPVQQNTPGPASKPLLIGVHGGTCTAYNFDISPQFTAATISDHLYVPFVAYNRPNYLGSDGWLRQNGKIGSQWSDIKDSTYLQEDGRWIDEYIFPALWQEFGRPNHCTGIVTTCHSLAVPGMVVGAALHARRAQSTYPLSGIILTGYAVNVRPGFMETFGELQKEDYQLPFEYDPEIEAKPMSVPFKEKLMVGDESLHLCPDELRPLVKRQSVSTFIGEAQDMFGIWPSYREDYMKDIKVPVLFALGGNDWIWEGSQDNVDKFIAPLKSCPRLEGIIVEKAPHALEWWNEADDWWKKVGTWAVEVTK